MRWKIIEIKLLKMIKTELTKVEDGIEDVENGRGNRCRMYKRTTIKY